MDLYEKAIEAIHGDAAVGQFDWVVEAREHNCLVGWQMLALLIFYLGIPGGRAGTYDDERRIVSDWHQHMRAAIGDGTLKAVDPITMLRVRAPSENADWEVSLEAADAFLREQEMPITFTTLIDHILSELGLKAPLAPPSTGSTVRWTPEFTEEVRAYRATHSASETAAQYGVTAARIREKLALPKPAAIKNNAFQWRNK